MTWLKYLWIPVTVGLGVLAWILFRERDATTIPNPKTEIRAIKAEAKIQKIKIDEGTEAALTVVEEAYAEELAAMSERDAELAEELLASPEKLAAFAIRAAR